jgi:hypothetical protein
MVDEVLKIALVTSPVVISATESNDLELMRDVDLSRLKQGNYVSESPTLM